MNTNKRTLLIVDDDESDILLINEMLSILKIDCHVLQCFDGDEVLPILKENPKVDLILLDLNMPRKDGFEVLSEIKTIKEYKVIPIIVLSTSDAESDIEKAYKLRANCYIRKPFELAGYETLLKSINNFWFNTARIRSNTN